MSEPAPHAWTLWDWPFFDRAHHDLGKQVMAWSGAQDRPAGHDSGIDYDRCRQTVKSLGDAGLLRFAVPENGEFDVRSLCVIREALTHEDALDDALFTMQSIGTLAIQQHGTEEQKTRYLPGCRAGDRVAAFALTEPDGGSDVASTATNAVPDGNGYVLNGEKTLISNAGFADHYIVVARTGEAPGARGLSAFIVDADTAGLTTGGPIHFIADHPAASVTLNECRVAGAALIGMPGDGFRVALSAFDIFRPSVGAASIGLARRAMSEALIRVRGRTLFGKPMGEMQGVLMALADMASDLESAALTVYRAAWAHDVRGDRSSYAASMAKLVGSEAAGRVVDRAVQLCGGMGVTRGSVLERLYREARPMRIYEGASEIQKLIIGRAIMSDRANP